MKKSIFVLLLITLFFSGISFGQEKKSEKIAVLPFQYDQIDESLVKTLESIFMFEIENQKKFETIPANSFKDNQQAADCFDVECAAALGEEFNCDKVICTKLIGLGEKIIVQYFLVDVKSGKEVLKEQLTSAKVDDMEQVIKRIVSSIAEGKPVADNAQVGTIMESETVEPNRRASNKNYGFSFGYLFPLQGYDGNDKIFTFDFRYGYELTDIEVGMLAGIRKGLALNVYSSYLFSRTDVSPYFGGSFGFHWVAHEGYYNDDKEGDGFEIGIRAGLRFFRTYGFQVVLNFEIIHTFNDFNDNAFVLTIGFL